VTRYERALLLAAPRQGDLQLVRSLSFVTFRIYIADLVKGVTLRIIWVLPHIW